MTVVDIRSNSDNQQRRQDAPLSSASGAEQQNAAFRRPSHDEIRRFQLEARRLQGQAVAELASLVGRGTVAAARWIASAVGSAVRAFGEAVAARRTYEVLSRLSDRELADIGLTRDQIPNVIWRQTRDAEDRRTAPQAAPEEAAEETTYRKAA